MGQKRKPADRQSGGKDAPNKKPKQNAAKEQRSKLIFEARPDWHAADLPPIDTKDVTTFPPQHAIEALHKHADDILQQEQSTYHASQMSTGSSQHKFMSTIMSSGTLEDKISALTLMVQESPLHNAKAFESLIGLAKKRSRNQALMAVAALKDMLGQGVLLPGDRKLRAFGKQPGVLAALQGKNAKWKEGEQLPGGIEKKHLVYWAYEDWLKRMFFELLIVLEGWSNDEVAFARSRAITYVYELLKDKPEQEENLLRLLVNKLGDTDRKIASRASYLLLQLENTHPAMRMVVTNSVEADCLMRPGQSLHAKYYAIITLNQTILSQKEESVANRLLEIYFALFVQLLKPTSKPAVQSAKPQPNAKGKPQGGGGKAGKMAAKKQKAQDRADDAQIQLNDKMIAQVLTGVNRAFPFADTSDPNFEKNLDTVFRVAHSSNFNTAVQALMLLQQISSTKHYGADRFYRTLYDSLLDPRLYSSSKQVMYLNLLYKSLKQDLSAKRVQAFVKRMLQIITMHEPPFVCGVLYLISELESTFPSIRTMITDSEWNEEDEEEHFVDVPEDGAADDKPSGEQQNDSSAPQQTGQRYDPRKRDPEYAHAERSCLWELLPFLQHFHPSVSLFAVSLLNHTPMPPKPDTTQHTLMHFLDRFVYKNAKSKPSTPHGASIMQPSVGSNAADLLVKPGAEGAHVPLNSEQFWAKKAEEVAPEDAFFHAYFSQAGKQKKKDTKKADRAMAAGEDGDEADEEEIWQAIAQSRPDVEGPDEDDDISLGDLESAYDKSDDDEGSEGGIDLGGDDDDGSEAGLDLGGEDDDEAGSAAGGATQEDFDDMDGFPDLDDEDGMIGSDEDIEGMDDEESEEEAPQKGGKQGDDRQWKKQRKEKKKVKALPTFASAEDYAKLLDDEPDDF
ncbi:CBF-domain-containing protein [Hortaea werneckii]|nr:CBF-domain-containing protein [Hortaea werneckii]KAI7093302.1 CBF-domain-containing protein [Hortaea werneckii]KAI7311731.1 CBF-domain-containing protein [Hortaea werneckii]